MTNKPTQYHTPEGIAKERKKYFGDSDNNVNQLNYIADEINTRINRFKHDVFNIGKLLTEAKELLPHGEFGNWVQNSCGLNHQTANNFMRVYGFCDGNPEIAEKISQSIIYKIASKNFPTQIKEYIRDNYERLQLKNKFIDDILENSKNEDYDESEEILKLNKQCLINDIEKLYTSYLEECLKELSTIQDKLHKTDIPIHPTEKTITIDQEWSNKFSDKIEQIENECERFKSKLLLLQADNLAELLSTSSNYSEKGKDWDELEFNDTDETINENEEMFGRYMDDHMDSKDTTNNDKDKD